ncbi:MAG: aspartate carbamoyltransferase catalytic subunit [Leptolyngbya sp. PLA2]|nr:aspartate carbamoyltransferase catalytic subunit [Leptolyngbya sp.]MCE7971237.1 aspartate carbamoyltransferase catalytic subunit [Leptolyngbya sp. PL-A2]MCQ3939595.1 aspartate carbamoyltransferase [cyanobacterium CYA1]MCZ7632163.1 aspartate carbamoyltransferase catalytic subunit [Phycisphaerales bacterium]MDL1903851.1 aspartate carbamoyltransferase catalytic subunit [Synechococcales cyanobacterium CNB]GIK18564.1 MAG: aspartate carbamoyltransferase [Planctomycetota bacterium]
MPSPHLLTLHNLPADEIRAILREAIAFRALAASGSLAPRLAGRTVGTLFFENSTRTRTSFSIAALRLGAEVIDLPVAGSSHAKGETLTDTARTVEALGVDALVVRASQSGAVEMIARRVGCAVLNAGDGRHEHPTQGLLDALTLADAMGRAETLDLSGLHVAIVGDVVSSRVARSNVFGLTALGATVTLVGPPALAPPSLGALAQRVRVEHDFDAVLPHADTVMMLRVQFERHGDAMRMASPAFASLREFRAACGLSSERAQRMKPGAVVMHPGPVNRGLELDGEVADSDRSLILKQVANGVPVRMASLVRCLDGLPVHS